MIARASALSDPGDVDDPAYVEGLRAAISAAIGYGLDGLEQGEERAPPIPTALFAQARQAARSGIGLDIVLRRYFGGFTLLSDYLMQEAERDPALTGAALHEVQRSRTVLFDRLLAAITEEYAREMRERPDSVEERRAERVRRFLAGDLPSDGDWEYGFEGFHLGLIAVGPGGLEVVRGLASALDRRLLAVRPTEQTVWAWLGGRAETHCARVEDVLSSPLPASVALVAGEPASGLAGWRLTHQQARASLPIALRRPGRLVRYADEALLASMLRDDLLVTSLRELYLAPLAEERDGGRSLRETLRAYFDAERNVSSAAAALGVTRQTVTNRFCTVEERLGRPLHSCALEMEAALRLEEVTGRVLPFGSR